MKPPGANDLSQLSVFSRLWLSYDKMNYNDSATETQTIIYDAALNLINIFSVPPCLCGYHTKLHSKHNLEATANGG